MIRFLCACGSFHIAHTDDETLFPIAFGHFLVHGRMVVLRSHFGLCYGLDRIS